MTVTGYYMFIYLDYEFNCVDNISDKLKPKKNLFKTQLVPIFSVTSLGKHDSIFD